MNRAIALASALLVAGCPAPPGKSASVAEVSDAKSANPKGPRSAPGAAPTTARGTASPTGSPEAPPVPDGSTPDAPNADEPSARLELGTVLALSPSVSLSLEEVRLTPFAAGKALAARLAVESEGAYFVVELAKGHRLALRHTELRLTHLDPKGATLRWTREPSSARPLDALATPASLNEAQRPGRLLRLKSGARVGLGNPLRLRRGDGELVTVVSVTLFPPAFRNEPGQRHDVFSRLPLGRTATGETGVRVRLEREGELLKVSVLPPKTPQPPQGPSPPR